MNHCNQCKFAKSTEHFYASNPSKCKECVKKNVGARRLENIDKIRAYDRARGNRQGPEYLREYRKNNRAKYSAHNKVNNALRDGKIDKCPCEICSSPKSVGHHDDYSKPLEVRWLCQAHHQQWHAKHGEGANANIEHIV